MKTTEKAALARLFSLQSSGRPGPRSVNPPKSMRSINKLNRSKHLPPVKSYGEANDVRKAQDAEHASK